MSPPRHYHNNFAASRGPSDTPDTEGQPGTIGYAGYNCLSTSCPLLYCTAIFMVVRQKKCRV